MADNWKNMDQVFQDKFSQYEAKPPEHVWANIRENLGDKPGNAADADPTIPPKGGGGISSLLIFLVVLLLVSFVNPINSDKRLVKGTTKSEIHIPSAKDYYSSEGMEIEIVQNKNLAAPREILTSAKSAEMQAVVAITQSEKNDKNKGILEELPQQEVIVTNQSQQLADIPLSGISQIRKLSQIQSSLLNDGYTEEFISGITKREIDTDVMDFGLIKSRVKGEWSMGISFTPEAVFFNAEDNFTNQRYSGGIDLYYKTKPFVFQTGINLLVTKDVGELKIDYEKFVGSYEDVEGITFDTINGIVTPNYQTETVNIYDSINHVAYSPLESRYYYLQLPLLAGYEFDRQRVSWSLLAGPVATFLISESNNAVTPSELERDKILGQEIQTPKRLNTNVQFMLLAGLEYKLSRNVSFTFHPQLRYNLTSVYEKDAVSTQHPYSIGIRTGLLIDF